jgi:hypothetical protein
MEKFSLLLAEALGWLVGGQAHIMLCTSVPSKKGDVHSIAYVQILEYSLSSNDVFSGWTLSWIRNVNTAPLTDTIKIKL